MRISCLPFAVNTILNFSIRILVNVRDCNAVRLYIYSLSHSFCSQSMSRVNNISENVMNFGIPPCKVRHLTGILNISLEIFPKKTIN